MITVIKMAAWAVNFAKDTVVWAVKFAAGTVIEAMKDVRLTFGEVKDTLAGLFWAE